MTRHAMPTGSTLALLALLERLQGREARLVRQMLAQTRTQTPTTDNRQEPRP